MYFHHLILYLTAEYFILYLTAGCGAPNTYKVWDENEEELFYGQYLNNHDDDFDCHWESIKGCAG
jgi:hypothetical protein